MYVKVSFDRVKYYFAIFPENEMKFSFYIEGEMDPRSIVISPLLDDGAYCDPEKISDEMRCINAEVYCVTGDEIITTRITGAGEILYYRLSCADIVAESFDFYEKQQLIYDDYDEFLEGIGI